MRCLRAALYSLRERTREHRTRAPCKWRINSVDSGVMTFPLTSMLFLHYSANETWKMKREHKAEPKTAQNRIRLLWAAVVETTDIAVLSSGSGDDACCHVQSLALKLKVVIRTLWTVIGYICCFRYWRASREEQPKKGLWGRRRMGV